MWSATAYTKEGEQAIVRSHERLLAIQVGCEQSQIAILYREDGSIEQVMVAPGTKVAEVKYRARTADIVSEWVAIHERD